MADKTPEQEPSIEEILASIRQIISDDEDKDAVEEPVPAPPPAPVAAPVQAPAPEPAPKASAPVPEPVEEEDDILELDTPIEEETFDIDLQETAPPPPPPPAEVEMDAPAPQVTPRKDDMIDEILTDTARHATIASMAKLAGNMPITRHRDHGNITLEDLVREMLNPMLRDWLSENMPPMVERMVQRELEKLARQAQDQ